MQASDERGERRAVVYCLVPSELAPKLHDLLRDHFRDDPRVEVVVEQRSRERRRRKDRRRREGGPPPGGERRRVHSATGRRVGERRAPLVPVEAPPLPRKARRYADRIAFVERLEPSGEGAEDLDTARLVTRFQAGDQQAFTTLYTRYFDRVYGYLTVALDDPYEAEDAAQQVFVRVFERLAEYERRRQPFRAWLFRIVRNNAVDQLRRRAARAEPVAPAQLPERPAEQADELAELSALAWVGDRDLLMLIERLAPAPRQVLMLRFLLDMSDRQIAEVLGRSPADVRTIQSRALRFLRDRLRALGREPKQSSRRGSRRPRRQDPAIRSRRYALLP